jgi:hypothetical protein
MLAEVKAGRVKGKGAEDREVIKEKNERQDPGVGNLKSNFV